MDLDPGSWGGLELGLKIGPVKTSSWQTTTNVTDEFGAVTRRAEGCSDAGSAFSRVIIRWVSEATGD